MLADLHTLGVGARGAHRAAKDLRRSVRADQLTCDAVRLAFAHAGSGFATLVANVSGANLAAAHVDLCVRGEVVAPHRHAAFEVPRCVFLPRVFHSTQAALERPL